MPGLWAGCMVCLSFAHACMWVKVCGLSTDAMFVDLVYLVGLPFGFCCIGLLPLFLYL